MLTWHLTEINLNAKIAKTEKEIKQTKTELNLK